MNKLIIILLHITTVLCCNCIDNQPVITNDFNVQEGSLCQYCNYFYKYPKGFDYVSVQFSYTGIIYFNIYQNNILLYNYNNTLCFSRFDIDFKYSTDILIYTTSKELVWSLTQHMITFHNKDSNLILPNLNSIISSNITITKYQYYTFSVPYTKELFVHMKFNSIVNININCDNLRVINTNTLLLFNNFNLVNYKCNTIDIIIYSYVDTKSVKLIALPKTINIINYLLDNNEKKTEVYNVENKNIIISYICITSILIILQILLYYCLYKYYLKHKQSYRELIEIDPNTQAVV